MQRGEDVIHVIATVPRRFGGGSEGMWGERVGADRVRLRNTPFSVPGLSYNDVVFTERRKGILRIAGVSLRGGHSTYWILTCAGASWEALWARLRALGCSYESTRVGDDRVCLAADVPPHAQIDDVLALLDEGVAEGIWEYEEGHREHP
ncbi:MAG: DUF4265 domain-containing protein [Anaeromyxobacteraceae bacterium]